MMVVLRMSGRAQVRRKEHALGVSGLIGNEATAAMWRDMSRCDAREVGGTVR